MKNIELTHTIKLKDLLKEVIDAGVSSKCYETGYRNMLAKLQHYVHLIEGDKK
jgi:hypothetical protein